MLWMTSLPSDEVYHLALKDNNDLAVLTSWENRMAAERIFFRFVFPSGGVRVGIIIRLINFASSA